MNNWHDLRLGIVGATGAVGQELLTILAEQGVDADHLRLFASTRSAGGVLAYRGTDRIPVAPVEAARWTELDACLFAADAATASTWVPPCLEAGCVVVDNSSAYREREDVPLVIPEVNGTQLAQRPQLVANPNCSTIILLVALQAIRERWGIREVRVATYQAVSGAGAAGIADLRESATAALTGSPATAGVFPQPSGFNVFCHESALDLVSGLCGEEQKMIREARKIWECPQLPISPFCVRVPVFRAHSQAIWIQLAQPASRRELRACLARARGVQLRDDPQLQDFPTPLRATGGNDILVGRLRPARIPAADTSSGFDDDLPLCDWTLFAAGDQLRKGAALNALQILAQLVAAETSVPTA